MTTRSRGMDCFRYARNDGLLLAPGVTTDAFQSIFSCSLWAARSGYEDAFFCFHI